MLGLSRKQLSSYLYLAFCRAYNAMKMSSASGVSHEIVYIAFLLLQKFRIPLRIPECCPEQL